MMVGPRYQRLCAIGHFTGRFLEVLGLVVLLPALVAGWSWGVRGDGWTTLGAFCGTALLSFVAGRLLRLKVPAAEPDMAASMLLCAVVWLVASAIGALPFVLALEASFLDAYFEAVSGFTTTGITVFAGLGEMPRSVLFWRALTQWLGGLGILSLFLALSLAPTNTHLILGAEAHKIATSRPAPGLHHTVRILWRIYSGYTLLSIVALTLCGMPLFDAVCHALTALSTGGFSPHDASIQAYRDAGHANFRAIEYVVTFCMLLGGINFLVHYRVLVGDARALIDHLEIRWWWYLLAGFTTVIAIEHLVAVRLPDPATTAVGWAELEETFRLTLFQVVSIITTTGFGTQDIGSWFFAAGAQQLFLVLMVIGGCVGSTGGGIKVLRVAVLHRMVVGQLFRGRISPRASSGLVIDGKLLPEAEVERIAALFFAWIALLLTGGVITALFTDHGALASVSGMFSALGNIGPCYIPPADIVVIHPVVKLTWIFGMLAGRLEILPVLMLFSRRAWF